MDARGPWCGYGGGKGNWLGALHDKSREVRFQFAPTTHFRSFPKQGVNEKAQHDKRDKKTGQDPGEVDEEARWGHGSYKRVFWSNKPIAVIDIRFDPTLERPETATRISETHRRDDRFREIFLKILKIRHARSGDLGVCSTPLPPESSGARRSRGRCPHRPTGPSRRMLRFRS